MRDSESRRSSRISAASALTASRINLLALLRVTAFPILRGTEIPTLAGSPGPSAERYAARSCFPYSRFPCVRTSLNSVRPRRTPGLTTMLQRSALVAHSELMATLRAAVGKDPSAVLGRHSCTKTMGVSSLSIVRLKRSLHRDCPSSNLEILELSPPEEDWGAKKSHSEVRENVRNRGETNKKRIRSVDWIFPLLSFQRCSIIHQGQPRDTLLITCQHASRNLRGILLKGTPHCG